MIREGVCIYLKDNTQWKQIVEALQNDGALRNRATRESPKWLQIGGKVDAITKKLHDERHKGNITSDVSYRAWSASDDSTMTIGCGTIDGTGEDWVEVRAKVDERVDTEIANKILRALGIRNKAEETRVETGLINGQAMRHMSATVSKKSAEQIAGLTFTADDEGLATPVKIIFGGETSGEPIEVDVAQKDNNSDVELTSPASPNLETPKSKKKKKRKKQASPANDQTDQSPDVVPKAKAIRQAATDEQFEAGDIVRAPKLNDLDGEYCTIRLAKPHEDGWEAHHISEAVVIERHEDNRGQKNFIVKGGGKRDKWFSFTGKKYGGEAGAKSKAEEEKQRRETETQEECFLTNTHKQDRGHAEYSLSRARNCVEAELQIDTKALVAGMREATSRNQTTKATTSGDKASKTTSKKIKK